jgi:hypothetical protein
MVHALLSLLRDRADVNTVGPTGAMVKVRIRKTPIEPEMDGVALDRLTPGRVCDLSSSLGSWLLAQGYAELEMRSTSGEDRDAMPTPRERGFSTVKRSPHLAADRRRRSR